MLNAQQVVHDLKALVPFWPVNSGDVHDALELALRVVTEEGEDLQDARGRGVKRELVLEDRELLDVFGQALQQIGAESVQSFGGLRVSGQSRIRGRWLGERGG